MRSLALILIFFSGLAITVNAQNEKKSIRQGNREFNKNDYISSEISYRKALEKNPSSFKGNFNLADALYKQDKQEETVKLLDGLSSANVDDNQKSNVYYNLGNSYLKQKKLTESIDSYKNSLRLNPSDAEAKYNLGEAQRLLKEQEKQDKNDKDNKDNNDNKDKNKDKKDQDKKDDKDKDKQNQDQKDKDKQQPQQQKMSQEDARRMLEALQNNEKQIQQKMKEQKAKAAKVKVEKNW